MTADDTTLAIYDREAGRYAERSRKEMDWAWIDKVAARLAPGATLLDLGCGAAWAAQAFAAKGFEVTAADGSAEMARTARYATSLDVRHMRFDELDAVAAYDAVWSSFALHHIPRADLPAVLTAIARALRPGGVLMMSMKTGSGEARDTLDRFYAYHSKAELEDRLTQAGFTVLDHETGEGTSFDGTPAGLIWLLAQKQDR